MGVSVEGRVMLPEAVMREAYVRDGRERSVWSIVKFCRNFIMLLLQRKT